MKKLFSNPQNFGLVLTVMVILASCVSMTLINSDPEGAKVYVNNMPVGETPYTYSDTKMLYSSTPIRLELEGYKPFNTVLIRNEEIDAGPVIGGFFFAWPLWLWAMKYQPVHLYELSPLNEK